MQLGGRQTTLVVSFIGVLTLLSAGGVSGLDRDQDLYPFGSRYDDVRLDVGDDVSSAEIHLDTPVIFFEDLHSTLIVSLMH